MPLRTRISDVRHTAETGCFEAYVTLIDGTDSYTYDVEYPAPINTDTAEIAAALVARARRMHLPSACRLTRHHLADTLSDRPGDMAQHILFSQPNYLEQILGRRTGETLRGA